MMCLTPPHVWQTGVHIAGAQEVFLCWTHFIMVTPFFNLWSAIKMLPKLHINKRKVF